MSLQQQRIVLGFDSFSILFNHRSFRKPAVSPGVFDGFLKRRIPGKNGDSAPTIVTCWTSKLVPSCGFRSLHCGDLVWIGLVWGDFWPGQRLGAIEYTRTYNPIVDLAHPNRFQHEVRTDLIGPLSLRALQRSQEHRMPWVRGKVHGPSSFLVDQAVVSLKVQPLRTFSLRKTWILSRTGPTL